MWRTMYSSIRVIQFGPARSILVVHENALRPCLLGGNAEFSDCTEYHQGKQKEGDGPTRVVLLWVSPTQTWRGRDPAVSACSNGGVAQVGVSMAFWEMNIVIAVPAPPECVPMLGGAG
jgi:hypothetical protein